MAEPCTASLPLLLIELGGFGLRLDEVCSSHSHLSGFGWFLFRSHSWPAALAGLELLNLGTKQKCVAVDHKGSQLPSRNKVSDRLYGDPSYRRRRTL